MAKIKPIRIVKDNRPQTQAQAKYGLSGNPAGITYRARRELNNDTIAAMHKAFRRGGDQAVNKVMRTQPGMFLKLLVLLVPREMEVSHSGTIKAMTDEQIERSIELIKDVLARRAAKRMKTIEHEPEAVGSLSKRVLALSAKASPEPKDE